MLSRRQKRKSNTKIRRYPSGSYYSTSRDSKLKLNKKTKQQSKLNRKFFIGFAVTGVLFFSLNSFIKVKSFNDGLNSSISLVGKSCIEYKKASSLNTILNLSFDKNNKLESVSTIAYDSEKAQEIDFTNTEFYIDKGYTLGNVKDYINSNNAYLNNDKVFENLSSLFLREFYIKADYIVVGTSGYTFNEYLDSFGQGITPKLIMGATPAVPGELRTNICKNNWNSLVSDLNRYEISKSNFDQKKKLSDLFYLGEIRKEQVRIHINNATGVEKWGDYIKALYENYGLNVVKVDNSTDTLSKSTIYLDNEDLKNTNSYKEILTLSDNKYETKVKDSIFSDVYIELGLDVLSL